LGSEAKGEGFITTLCHRKHIEVDGLFGASRFEVH